MTKTMEANKIIEGCDYVEPSGEMQKLVLYKNSDVVVYNGIFQRVKRKYGKYDRKPIIVPLNALNHD